MKSICQMGKFAYHFVAQTECGSNNCNQTCYVDPTEGEKCQCRSGYTLGMDGESCNGLLIMWIYRIWCINCEAHSVFV